MKTFVCIVFVLVAIVAAQGYGSPHRPGPHQGPGPSRPPQGQGPHRPPQGQGPHRPPQGPGPHRPPPRPPHGPGPHGPNPNRPPNHENFGHPSSWSHSSSDSNDHDDYSSSSSSSSGSSDEDYSNRPEIKHKFPQGPKHPCRWPRNCKPRPPPRPAPRPVPRPTPPTSTTHTRRPLPPTVSTVRTPPSTIATPIPTARPPPSTYKTPRPPISTNPPPSTIRLPLKPWTQPPTPPVTPPPSTLETTTGFLADTTPTDNKGTTTSASVAKCIAQCKTTPEYNPVCGTNGQTYDNEGKLICAQNCGVDVTLRRRSVCPPPTPAPTPPTRPGPRTTPPPTSSTTTEAIVTGPPLTKFQRCTRQCAINGTFAPVCGTDLVTYMNMERLACAQSCGEVVQVLCEKSCAACGYNPLPIVTPKTSTFAPPTIPGIGKTADEYDYVNECIKACPMATTEYKPICGTNNVTYNNPGTMLCAQVCGVSVTVAKFSACSTSRSPTTTTEMDLETTTSGRSLVKRDCIRNCPVTSEYNPVCGSDARTYSNPGHLECAKNCGVDVVLRMKSRCPPDFKPETDSTTMKTTAYTIDKNRDRTRGTSSFTTMSTTSGIITSSSTRRPRTTTIGFSLPPDILATIFGSSSSTTPISTNDDEDESLDIDPRFGNNDADDNDSKVIFPE